MYQSLWDQSPIVKKMKAASRAEERIETLQYAVKTVIGARFPILTELAQQKVSQINDPEKLNNLLTQISTAPDEASARLLLAPTVACLNMGS